MRPSDFDPESLKGALAALAETAKPRDDCPAADEIWRTLAGELDPPATRSVVEHVAECLACAEAWDITRDLVEEAKAIAPADHPDVSDRNRVRRWAPWLAAAAILCLAIGLPQLDRSTTPQQRSGAATSIQLEASEISRQGGRVRWSGPASVETYRLEWSWATPESSGQLLPPSEVEARAGAGSFELTPEHLSGVPEGAVLMLGVTALRGGESFDREVLRLPLEH